jgi:hydrogenase maturation factor HypE
MNGLERAGEHGLFYYVVEASDLAIGAGSTISFTVGERSFVSRRPPLSKLGVEGTRGLARDQMRFRGKMEGGDVVLICEGAGNSCPASTLRFKRILEK